MRKEGWEKQGWEEKRAISIDPYMVCLVVFIDKGYRTFHSAPLSSHPILILPLKPFVDFVSIGLTGGEVQRTPPRITKRSHRGLATPQRMISHEILHLHHPVQLRN